MQLLSACHQVFDEGKFSINIGSGHAFFIGVTNTVLPAFLFPSALFRVLHFKLQVLAQISPLLLNRFHLFQLL